MAQNVRCLEKNLWKLTNKSDSICIIGAGVAGLSTANRLLQSGYTNITIYDYKPDLGGVWAQPYPHLYLQSNIKFYQFPEFAFTKYKQNETPYSIISGTRTKEYLYDYAKHFNIVPHLQLNTRIMEANFDKENQKWIVNICQNTEINPSKTNYNYHEYTYTGIKDKNPNLSHFEKEFDFIINCGGIFSAPDAKLDKMKRINYNIDSKDCNYNYNCNVDNENVSKAAQATQQSKILHPSEIDDEILQDMIENGKNKIVIAGGGKTGRDIACAIAYQRGKRHMHNCKGNKENDDDMDDCNCNCNCNYEAVTIVDKKGLYAVPWPMKIFGKWALPPSPPVFSPFFTKYPNSYENSDNMQWYKILRNVLFFLSHKFINIVCKYETPKHLRYPKSWTDMPIASSHVEPIRQLDKPQQGYYTKGYYFENIKNGDLVIQHRKELIGINTNSSNNNNNINIIIKSIDIDDEIIINNVDYLIIAFGMVKQLNSVNYLKNKENDFDKLTVKNKNGNNEIGNNINLMLYRNIINPDLPQMLFNGFCTGYDHQVPVYFGSAFISYLMQDKIDYNKLPDINGMKQWVLKDIEYRILNNLDWNGCIDPFRYSWYCSFFMFS